MLYIYSQQLFIILLTLIQDLWVELIRLNWLMIILPNLMEIQIQYINYLQKIQKLRIYQKQNIKNKLLIQEKRNHNIVEPNSTQEIKLKTQCFLELFIMTQFAKNQQYHMIYYLNRDYLNLFLNMIRLKDLGIELSIQQYIIRQVVKNKNFQQPFFDNLHIQRQDYSDFKVRDDIFTFQSEIKNHLAPHFTQLLPQIEKFLQSTRRYEIESRSLIHGIEVGDIIGQGLFSRVNRVIFEGQTYASKISSITFNPLTNEFCDQQLEKLHSRINEINLLSEIEDYKIPYVLRNIHIGFKFVQLNWEEQNCIKIFSLSPLYSPFSVIQAQNDQDKLKFAEKIAICLKQLQMRGISNYNLKSESVHVDVNNDPILINFVSQSCDFISKLNKTNNNTVVNPDLQKSAQICRQCNVYQFGIILYELFVGRQPLDDISQQNRNQYLSQRVHIEEMQNIKIREIQQLMNNCVKTDPNKRFSLSQVLHQFLIMNPCRIDVLQLLN
ncbi:hypothetical protein pb186bvf_002631 [Paramecium bursaria]